MEMILTPTDLILRLSGAERFWAVRFQRELVIPRSAVVSVSTKRPTMTWRTLRMPGTSVRGVITAGTYYREGGKEFWYTTGRSEPVLNLELDDTQPFRRIVVNNPSATGLDASSILLQSAAA